ncbi:hypothetical protein LUZ61_004824 [Rhynchospora tenuis]|uniref:Integrase catalytic domain-containing protein n=1 Tax=Rhynchospora tenuis TaxID=198213 RepID=A0AAD5ZNF7_9POAL|nr:hypothetical protein LUZ61_004824 [Rhynchospora tenuis]
MSTMASSTTTSVPVVSRSAVPINVNHQIQTVLSHDNFLLWRSQITPVLRGHGLIGYVDGSKTVPAPVITNGDNVVISNPEFQEWQQQDQLILAWLFSSLSQQVLAQVVNCQTSAELWRCLNTFHTSQSVAKVLDLRLQLQTIKRGGASCSQFLQQIQGIADRLRSIGSDVPDHDLVLYTLQGLGTEFETFVTAVSMRENCPSMSELTSMILAQEARILTSLKSQILSVNFVSGQTSNAAGNSDQSAFFVQNNKGKAPAQQNQQNYHSNRGNYRGRGRGNYRGRGRGRTYTPQSSNQQTQNAENSQCQICTKWGHSALECYHRFDIRYTVTSNPSPQPPPQAMLAEPAPTTASNWYIDSGATSHITSDINNLSSYHPYEGPEAVHIANGTGLKITHKGLAYIQTGTKTLKLINVLLVPDITKNLLSVSQLLADNNVKIEFSSDSCFVKDLATNKVLLHGSLSNGLYALSQDCSTSSQQQLFLASLDSSVLWHYKLAHCSVNVLDRLRKARIIVSKPISCNNCIGCNKAKAHKLPFMLSNSTTSKPLELIHSDMWGPSPVASERGNRYYVSFTDDFTRFTWLFPCACKSDVPSIFDKFRARVENLLTAKIQRFQCDGGTEFKPIMSHHSDITFQVSCPHTPEQNGVAERKHRHIVELGLANMFHSSIPLKYWDYLFESVVFVINRIPSTSSGTISPFEKMFNQKPNYNMLHVLGCACFPLLKPYTKHKLEPRSEQCIFLGYSSMYKGYYCLLPSTQKIYISRHVIFDENTLPFSNLTTSQPNQTSFTPLNSTLTLLPSTITNSVSQNAITSTTMVSQLIPQSVSQPPTATPIASPQQTSIQSPTVIPFQTPQTTAPLLVTTSQIQSAKPVHSMVTRSKTNKLKTKQYPDHKVFQVDHTSIVEPTCYTQAAKHTCWRQAMASELTALAHNSTWDLVPPPSNAHVIGAKWVFKVKYKPDGSVERYKARLVAKGYNQEQGIDYEETFSPVIKPTTIRTVLTIALSKQWSIQQLDVNNAFLHGDIEETVYMEQPPGFSDPTHPNYVCKLNKAIYGLKQAPRAWFFKLKQFLLANGFKSTQSDYSLFVYQSAQVIIYLLVYVDDIILTGNNDTAIQKLMQLLHSQFSLKNLGNLNYFLGIEVHSDGSTLHLSQSRYLQTILQRAAMHTAKPCQTPMATGTQMSKYSGTAMDDPQQYRSIVGALQYATITRPDLTFAVNKASQFMANPTDLHWQLVKRILRYIRGTLSYGLKLQSAAQLALHAYCDADWAGCPDDRRSTTGFAIFLGPNLISWSSKKQATVSRSSTEAEYRSLAATASELTWLNSLLAELKFNPAQKPTMWCDNLGATFLAANPVFHARTKHIELDFHFVREKVEQKQLFVKYICSDDQLGDIFTKGLSKNRFHLLRRKLHVSEGQSSLRGAVEEAENNRLDASSIDEMDSSDD